MGTTMSLTPSCLRAKISCVQTSNRDMSTSTINKDEKHTITKNKSEIADLGQIQHRANLTERPTPEFDQQIRTLPNQNKKLAENEDKNPTTLLVYVIFQKSLIINERDGNQ